MFSPGPVVGGKEESRRAHRGARDWPFDRPIPSPIYSPVCGRGTKKLEEGDVGTPSWGGEDRSHGTALPDRVVGQSSAKQSRGIHLIDKFLLQPTPKHKYTHIGTSSMLFNTAAKSLLRVESPRRKPPALRGKPSAKHSRPKFVCRLPQEQLLWVPGEEP